MSRTKENFILESVRLIKNLAPSARLGQLRKDLLDAPYELCAQKAGLMTSFFERDMKISLLLKIVMGIHSFFYKRSIEDLRLGRAAPRWQMKLNQRLAALYRWIESSNPGEMSLCHAQSLRYILEHSEVRIYPHELIVGNLTSRRIGAAIHPDLGGVLMLPELKGLDQRSVTPIKITPDQKKDLTERILPFWFHRSILSKTLLYTKNLDLFPDMMRGDAYVLTQFSGISHVTPDYPAVLKEGLSGLRRRTQERKERLSSERAHRAVMSDREFLEQNAFLDAVIVSLDAAIKFSQRWARSVDLEASKASDVVRAAELRSIARILRKVPEHPAASFHEALQSIFLTHAILHQENFQHGISLGRLDQYLYPYYKADLESGAISRESALELMGSFLGKLAEVIPLFFDRATEYFSGLSSASGITLGGLLPDGQDGVNELSFLILAAYDQMRLRQPNIHVRVHSKSNQEFLEYCCELLKKGGGMPAFFNDEEIVKSQVKIGFTKERAAKYSIVGCAEWGIPHESFPAAGAGFVSLPAVLLMTLNNGLLNGRPLGAVTGDPRTWSSLEELKEAFRKQLQNLLHVAVEGNNAIETAHQQHRPTPFLSSVIAGSLESAKDVTSGGARYNSTGFQAVGLADTADSLKAIEDLVFKNNAVTMDEFLRALKSNFKGVESLRSKILSKVSKFGVDDEASDSWAAWVAQIYSEEISQFQNPRQGPYLAGFWVMTTHQGFGHRLGALPSGRLSGEPLANGVSPYFGVDRLGPTACMNSVSSIKGENVSNGYVLNQKLDPQHFKGDSGNQLMAALVRGYFDRGGMQVQFNMIDPEVLLDARKNPEKYRDLVVRISGYSAYFNDLTDAMKDELIARTLYSSC